MTISRNGWRWRCPLGEWKSKNWSGRAPIESSGDLAGAFLLAGLLDILLIRILLFNDREGRKFSEGLHGLDSCFLYWKCILSVGFSKGESKMHISKKAACAMAVAALCTFSLSTSVMAADSVINASEVNISVKGGSRGLVGAGITPGKVYISANVWND